MKVLLKILAVPGMLLALFVVMSMLLPANHKIMSSTVINAPLTQVYSNLVDFKNWNRWNVWDQRDGLSNLATSEPSHGLGAWHEWKDKVHGHIKAVFTYGEGRQSLYYRLFFNDQGITAIGSFQLQVIGDDTHVLWTIGERVGLNPLKRWYSLFYALRAGRELSQAMGNLKRVCEAGGTE